MIPSPRAAQIVKAAFGPKPSVRTIPLPSGKTMIGWGHLLRSGEKIQLPLSFSSCDALLKKDLEEAAFLLNAVVTARLDQHHIDALSPWVLQASTQQCENAGENWATSQLIQHLNAERFVLAGSEFSKWTIYRGRVERRLVHQRSLEATLFQTGELHHANPPAPTRPR